MTEPHAVRLNDLLDALHRTEIHLGKLWEASGTDTGKAGLWAARSAFADLRQQLTPERGGAGETHPSEAPPEPAPSPDYRVTLRGGGAGTTDGPGEPGSVTITLSPAHVSDPSECTVKRPAHGDMLGRVCHRPPHTEGAHLDGAGWWL